MVRIVWIMAIVAAVNGCMHGRLRQRADNQVRTLSDFYEQQVLDNLAMFASDPGALPFFAYASQGTSSMTDQAGLSLYTVLQRTSLESWQLTPVNDPRKLELMRCTYQQVIAMHCSQAIVVDCPDCQRLLQNFYTGDPELRIAQRGGPGIVTSDCLTRPWLSIGCARCGAKHAGRVGRYGGSLVWARRGGSEELAKLTLVILDYALHDPPAKPMKSVTFHLSERGELTTSGKSFVDVSGQISADEANDSLATMPYIVALKRICGRNAYGLTVDALLALDPRSLADPAGNLDFRNRFQISDLEWREIVNLLIRLRSYRVDSPLAIESVHGAASFNSGSPRMDSFDSPPGIPRPVQPTAREGIPPRR